MQFIVVKYADTIDLSGFSIGEVVTISGLTGNIDSIGKSSDPVTGDPTLLPHTHPIDLPSGNTGEAEPV